MGPCGARLPGQGRRPRRVRRLIRRTLDGAFTLDLAYFEFQTTVERSYSPRFVELFGPPELHRMPAPDEWMRRFGALPLLHQPGERWMYCYPDDAFVEY